MKTKKPKSKNSKKAQNSIRTTFSDAVDEHNDRTRTANGMKARKNTARKTLDFFGKAGSYRGTDLSSLFMQALREDEDLALRALQWTRDVRGGSGEREQFRTILNTLDKKHPEIAAKLIPKIPELGRFDDLFSYVNKTSRGLALELIKVSLENKNGLCAKWMPRKGPVAVELTKYMGLTPKAYRRLVVDNTNVVETQMCSKEWDAINFSQVPSVASARYQKAFKRNAEGKYEEYLLELQNPYSKAKINAGAVYPYDVIKSLRNGNISASNSQWKALPNFIGNSKIIPMVDVSGSMMGGGNPSPIEVATSLGLYVSENNTSAFKDMILTFSETPEMVKVSGSLQDRLSRLMRTNWGMNTDLNKAFDEIIRIAKKGKVSQADMPEMLLILSDMQFDQCTGTRYDDSAQRMIRRKFESQKYQTPKIVFWNLAANLAHDNSPVRFDNRGVCLISGFSPAIMKAVLSSDFNEEDFTPLNVMLKTLNVERYDI